MLNISRQDRFSIQGRDYYAEIGTNMTQTRKKVALCMIFDQVDRQPLFQFSPRQPHSVTTVAVNHQCTSGEQTMQKKSQEEEDDHFLDSIGMCKHMKALHL